MLLDRIHLNTGVEAYNFEKSIDYFIYVEPDLDIIQAYESLYQQEDLLTIVNHFHQTSQAYSGYRE